MNARARRLTLATATLLLAACGPTPPTVPADAGRKAAAAPAAERKPNPPFQGETPKGAARHDVTGKYGGTLTFPLAGNPKTFNPILANETSTTDAIFTLVHRNLVDFDRDKLEDLADLATSWEHSPDFLVWTIKLREGVRWSDGHPLTADDLLFAYQVALDPKVQTAIKSGLLDDQGRAAKADKIDDVTVRFTLPAPNTHYYIDVGNVFPLPKHVLETTWKEGKFSTDAYSLNTPPDQIVVAGPFKVKEFVQDQKLVLERNPWYHAVDRDGNRLPYVDRIVFVITPNFDTSLLKFKSGEVDSVEPYVLPKDYPGLKAGAEQGGYTVRQAGLSFNTNFWWVNQNTGKSKDGKPCVDPQKLKWFRNQKFRQALAHATDRDGMVQTAFLRFAQPMWSIMSPANTKWYNPNVPKFEFDLEKAKGILDELGFKDRNGDGVREDPDGKPFAMTITTNSENTERQRMVSILVDDLGKIGIKATSDPIVFNALVDKLRHTYDYDACMLGLGTGIPPSPILGKNVYLSSGITHYWFPQQVGKPSYDWEQRIDDLMGQFDKTDKYEEQKKAFDEVQQIIAEQQAVIPTVVLNYYVAYKNRLKNVRPTPLRPSLYWNVEELWVE